MSRQIEDALKMAVNAHHGQEDKLGVPYIFHVIEVWQAVRNDGCGYAEQCVALLHDVVEDTSISMRDVGDYFDPDVCKAVDAITKRKGESRTAYLDRVASNPVAKRVKLADAYDNFRRLPNMPAGKERDRLHKKYASTLTRLHAEAPAP
jgi:(p)ppGpp synthase/HD superfamily hydrolase